MPTIPYHDDDHIDTSDSADDFLGIIKINSQESFNSMCISSQNITQLTVSIRDCQLVSSELMIHLKSLETFILVCSSVSLKADFLLNLPESLETIEIALFSDDSQQPLFLNLSKFHNLCMLSLSDVPLMEGAFEGINNLEHLTDLTLAFKGSIDELNCISNCTKLKNLSLDYLECLDDDTLIEIIDNNYNLEELSISGAPNITNSSVKFIQILPHLKSFHIYECESVTFTFFTEMPSLEDFHCCKCGNTPTQSFVKLLLLAPNLKSLTVAGCSGILELIQVANLIVQERENQSVLEMGVDVPLSQIDSENLSPNLKITQEYDLSGDFVFSPISPE